MASGHSWLFKSIKNGRVKAEEAQRSFGRCCWAPGSPVQPQLPAGITAMSLRISLCPCQAQLSQQQTSSSQRSALALFQEDSFPQTLGTTMNLNFSAKNVLSRVFTIPTTKLRTIKRMNSLCNSGQLDSSSATIAEFLHDLEPTKLFTDAHGSHAEHFVCPT